MTAVTYTAKSGYKFPETSDYYTTTNGIKVERTSDTVVTVSGTPDGVANITVPDAVHFHSFTYSASGAGITATCGNNGCGLTDSKATLAIDAPTMTTYGQTGESISEATLNGLEAFNTATGLSVSSESILYYRATKIDTTYTKSGNALSAAPTDAGDYLAEITLSGVKTSAGENQSVTASVGYSIAQATPTITTAPTVGEITYGQTLADSTLTGGGASVAGSFAWKDSTVAPAVSDSQTTEYDVVFTPTDGNYGTTECKVKLTVKKADSAVTKAPEAKTLTYTGSAQELVTAGTATGGTMQYALGTKDAATQPYTTSIPTATDAGTYYVWYKVVGDGNHRDTEEKCVEVTIAEDKKEEKKEEKKEDAKKEITVFDNEPLAYSEETKGDFRIGYCHEIPFAGKGKLTVESFGENFTVLQGNESYKVKKIKANKKKHRIQILKLENAPKDVEKDVKKATKGDNGIPYTQNPYYVRDTDKVTPKFKKSGAAASVKVNINGKDYKAKKTEYDYNEASKLIIFKGDNLAGSWAVK